MIEANVETTEVVIANDIEVTSTSDVTAEVVDLGDLDITVAKREYVITGDDIYIPVLYDDAPQWMKDLVQVVVDVSIETGNQDLINDMTAMLQNFAVSYVPLNQYTQTILDLSDEDSRINALITTLNSNFSDGLSQSNAQIIELQLTKASKDEVVAQIIQTIAAQLADKTSNIGATVDRIDQAIATETSARALSFQVLTASLEDTNLDVQANATATHILNTYVGIELGVPNGTGLLAVASEVTNLSAELSSGENTWANADSTLENSLLTEISDEGTRVESKFAYNSVVGINGVYKKSGFGLTTNYISGSGTEVNPYISEFWIDASRLKFTNSNKTGSKAPFTIDATGTIPEITFNGKVSFSNVIDASQEVVTAINNGQTTTINGPKITTGSITAAQIQASSVSADRLMAGTNGSTVWTGGGLVSQNFNGNPYGNIGSPTSGFRLSSGAAGTVNDPNIYGAYIKGSTIDVEDMKVKAVGYPNNFGRVSFSAKNIPVVMPGYGTGFDQKRLCSKSVGIIKVDCWARGYDDRTIIALQYTTDYITWANIRVHSSLIAGMTNSSHVVLCFSELIDNYLANDDGYIAFRLVDAGSEQPQSNVYSDIVVSVFNS